VLQEKTKGKKNQDKDTSTDEVQTVYKKRSRREREYLCCVLQDNQDKVTSTGEVQSKREYKKESSPGNGCLSILSAVRVVG
jgi:hypothetical protein